MTRIDEAALLELAAGAVAASGVPRADAEVTARILVTGDLLGVHTHGVDRAITYSDRVARGGVNPRPKIAVERVAPALIKVDGDNGLGPVVGMRALKEAMAAASELGVAIALARRSNHFGAVAPYSLIAAEAGFASIIGSNASLSIAPTGGREARLGNSPVAFCVPNPDGQPFLLDMALSVVARAKIREAARRGTPIPNTWGTDRDGKPTTDAKAALDGVLLPVGGHKGYGLALAVDLFAGLLSDAAYLTHVRSWLEEPAEPSELGHFYILLDTKRLGSTAWLAHRMADFAAIIHATEPADPAEPVRVPGERELAMMERQRREGIEIDDAVLAKLRSLVAPA
jgi:LDH2 family malate/lactate/ureidoglycolate dehydrogenase